MAKSKNLSSAIRRMFKAQETLHRAFPKKPFTPDGRMIGDIGEGIAEMEYQVRIDWKLRRHWDGASDSSKGKHFDVQVKATQKDETYLKRPPHDGTLLVFYISRDGRWECCYNGSIMRVWRSLKNLKENSAREKFIKLEKLRALGRSVHTRERIPLRRGRK